MNDLTVVIATYDRRNWLSELIVALQHQEPPVDIIVSDDGTEPFTVRETIPGVTRYIWAPRDGGYHRVKRFNEGVSLVRTQFVVMLDDDCLPLTNYWASAHIALLQDNQVVRGCFWDNGNYAFTPWFSSINVSMRTRLAQYLGPFDANYDGRYGHEDTDLGKTIAWHKYTMVQGGPETAAVHRGDQRHEYHVGHEENAEYFRKKWNVP